MTKLTAREFNIDKMKNWAIVVFFLASTMVQAQTDTIRDTLRNRGETSNPESFYNDHLPKDLAPLKDSVEVPIDRLPAKLKKALRKNDALTGWENGSAYYDKTNQVYKLYIPQGNTIRIHGFTGNGKPVSFRSIKKPAASPSG